MTMTFYGQKVQVTRRAEATAQMLGVPQKGIALAALFGQPRRIRGGKVCRVLSSRTLKRAWRVLGTRPSDADRLEGTAVLTLDVNEVRVVVTVLAKDRRGMRAVWRKGAAQTRQWRMRHEWEATLDAA